MILSHRHRFVFIKTRKTASTSLEIFFSQFCGDDDIVTPVMAEDEIIRHDLGGCLPQHYSANSRREDEYRAAIRCADVEQMKRALKAKDMLYRNHMSLAEVSSQVSIPDDYLVISSDRHPYEKVVSMTYFRLRNKELDDAEFARELERVIDSEKYRNIDMYRDRQGRLATRIIRYEALQADTRAICEELGLEFQPRGLPSTKANFRESRDDAGTVLTNEQKHRIAEICAEEFKVYGYQP